MKKSNYLLIGIIIVVILIILIAIFMVNQKKIPNNEENTINETSNTDEIPVNNSTIESSVNLSGNFIIDLKAKNPQYKEGDIVYFVYEVVNLENKTLFIPKNIETGIEIKDSVGTPVKTYTFSNSLIKDDLTLGPLNKTSNEISINSSDYYLSGDSYYAVDIYIGSAKSNRAMVRILK